MIEKAFGVFRWLTLLLLILPIVGSFDIFDIVKTRHSAFQTYAVLALLNSFTITYLLSRRIPRGMRGLNFVFKPFVAYPVMVILILLLLTSMNQ